MSTVGRSGLFVLPSVIALACFACTPLDRPVAPAIDADAAIEGGATQQMTDPVVIDPSAGGAGGLGGSGSGSGSGNGSAPSPTAGTGGGTLPGAGASGSGGPGTSTAGSSGGDPSASGACAPNQLSCGGSCVPNDERNCGTCGHDCTALPNLVGAISCSAEGKCVFDATACAPGYGSCAGDPEKGCDTDLKQATTCGKCETACSGATPVCAGPMGCVSGCPAPTPALCGAACADLQTDPMHCGSCEQACTTDVARAMVTCEAGACGFKCAGDFMACGKACVDTKTDVANCGGCGTKCPSGASCNQGKCECGAGTHDCSGKCVSDTDVATCGKMCSPCRATVANAIAICQNGQCDSMCSGSRTECSGACVDTKVDASNCGRCGASCGSGQSCVSGKCACPSGQHDCNGACVSNTSVNACGTSGCVKCPGPTEGSGTASCNGTSCDFTCSASTPMKCGSACVNIYDDDRHCGGCNAAACGSGTSCISGKCACPGGTLSCDSSGLGGPGIECQDPNSVNSCGGCWIHCPLDPNGRASCDSQACNITCTPPYTLVNGTCA